MAHCFIYSDTLKTQISDQASELLTVGGKLRRIENELEQNLDKSNVVRQQLAEVETQRDELQARLDDREQELKERETDLAEFKLEAERRKSQQVGKYIEGLLVEIPPAEREDLSKSLSSLVTSRRALLKQTVAVNSTLLRALGDLDFQESQLMSSAREFDARIASQVLPEEAEDLPQGEEDSCPACGANLAAQATSCPDCGLGLG